jgi:hypothetical protein
MSTIITHNVLSIDHQIFLDLKAFEAEVIGIYHHTFHLLSQGEVITVGSNLSEGKHHVVVDGPSDFSDSMMTIHEMVKIHDHMIRLGKYLFIIKEEAIKDYKPYRKTYQKHQELPLTLSLLKNMIQKEHDFNVFNYPKDDPWYAFQFAKIDHFLRMPTLQTAKSILGLGAGLTPLGDDILTGYLLACNLLNKRPFWAMQIVQLAKQKTSRIAYQNLYDTYHGYYPKIFHDLIEDVFINNHLNRTQAILKLGGTSGAGILTGFLYGCI